MQLPIIYNGIVKVSRDIMHHDLCRYSHSFLGHFGIPSQIVVSWKCFLQLIHRRKCKMASILMILLTGELMEILCPMVKNSF